jgi:hypothetical protein
LEGEGTGTACGEEVGLGDDGFEYVSKVYGDAQYGGDVERQYKDQGLDSTAAIAAVVGARAAVTVTALLQVKAAGVGWLHIPLASPLSICLHCSRQS